MTFAVHLIRNIYRHCCCPRVAVKEAIRSGPAVRQHQFHDHLLEHALSDKAILESMHIEQGKLRICIEQTIVPLRGVLLSTG